MSERFKYLVDTHVHLREPGGTHKEDFDSGTSAALAGGVAMVIDMPNNLQLVTNSNLLNRKRKLAQEKSRSDTRFQIM